MCVALLLAGATPSGATSCLLSWTPCQAFGHPVVFVGEVLRVEQAGSGRVHRVRVLRTLKGRRTGIVDVSTSGGIGPSLVAGARYVIFTHSATGPISLGDCDPLVALVPGEPDPEWPPVMGRVYGRIGREALLASSSAAVAGARLSLDLPSGGRTAVSDRFGRFQFADVPPGDYPLGVRAAGLEPSGAPRVVLRSTDGCISILVGMHPAGRISGRVVGPGGRPAPGIPVRAVDATDSRRSLPTAVTGTDGRFTIRGLDAGTYLLAVNPTGQPTVRQPFRTAWFGGQDQASARRLRLAHDRPGRCAGFAGRTGRSVHALRYHSLTPEVPIRH